MMSVVEGENVIVVVERSGVEWSCEELDGVVFCGVVERQGAVASPVVRRDESSSRRGSAFRAPTF
jgi:hypothetical protein